MPTRKVIPSTHESLQNYKIIGPPERFIYAPFLLSLLLDESKWILDLISKLGILDFFAFYKVNKFYALKDIDATLQRT